MNLSNQNILFVPERKDQRDKRPMAQPGRYLMPSNAGPDWLWKDSQLFKSRRTPDAIQLPAKSMIMIEDMSPQALPNTDQSHVHGASKYAQIGCDAACKLLSSAIETSCSFDVCFVFEKCDNILIIMFLNF